MRKTAFKDVEMQARYLKAWIMLEIFPYIVTRSKVHLSFYYVEEVNCNPWCTCETIPYGKVYDFH